MTVPTPQAEALAPKFGDLLRNTMAGENNPHRDAYFIRKVTRSGRLNPGQWFEMTDGKGETWLTNPKWQITAPESAELRRLHALTTRAPDAEAESVWLFKATDGKWMHFVSEKHRLDTMADDRWEVRQFFAAPPAPEALEVP